MLRLSFRPLRARQGYTNWWPSMCEITHPGLIGFNRRQEIGHKQGSAARRANIIWSILYRFPRECLASSALGAPLAPINAPGHKAPAVPAWLGRFSKSKRPRNGPAAPKAHRNDVHSNHNSCSVTETRQPQADRISSGADQPQAWRDIVFRDAGGLLGTRVFPLRGLSFSLTVLEEARQSNREYRPRGAFWALRGHTAASLSIAVLFSWRAAWFAARIELPQSEFKRSEQVRDLLSAIPETLLSQVQQTVACNAMHSTEENVPPAPMMVHDRAEGEVLTYTHEFVTHAGCQSEIGDALQRSRCRHSRSDQLSPGQDANFWIAPVSEKASCECYAIVRDRFGRLFFDPPTTAVQGNTKAVGKSEKPPKR